MEIEGLEEFFDELRESALEDDVYNSKQKATIGDWVQYLKRHMNFDWYYWSDKERSYEKIHGIIHHLDDLIENNMSSKILFSIEDLIRSIELSDERYLKSEWSAKQRSDTVAAVLAAFEVCSSGPPIHE